MTNTPHAALAAALRVERETFFRQEAEARSGALDHDQLTTIIEQAIFETDTGLMAALLAADRILAALEPRELDDNEAAAEEATWD